MRNYILVACLILVVLASGCTQQDLIGGQRDEHGCLGPAGYSWNSTLDVCLREWEFDDSYLRDVAKTASDYLAEKGYDYALTLTGIDIGKCDGCFVIHFSTEKNKLDVTTVDWKVSGMKIS